MEKEDWLLLLLADGERAEPIQNVCRMGRWTETSA